MDIKKLGQRDLDCTTNGTDACETRLIASVR